jgi:hypothetical protein
MPQLYCVSIFVQGPLRLEQTYRSILNTLTTRIASVDRRLALFVLRVPNAVPTLPHWTFSVRALEHMINANNSVFSVIRPSAGVDIDVGLDVGWRCGTLSLPSSEGASDPDNMMKRYIVWTPLPQGLTWLCRF